MAGICSYASSPFSGSFLVYILKGWQLAAYGLGGCVDNAFKFVFVILSSGAVPHTHGECEHTFNDSPIKLQHDCRVSFEFPKLPQKVQSLLSFSFSLGYYVYSKKGKILGNVGIHVVQLGPSCT